MTSHAERSRNRPLVSRWSGLGLAVLTVVLSVSGLALAALPANAANVAVAQCNNLNGGPLGATTGITCAVTVVNTVSSTGATSSTVTIERACSLEPCPPGNGSFTTSSTDLVTDINQCNGSGNDAAPPLITCTVTVTNNIGAGAPGARPVTAATVNQCVGSGTGGGNYGGRGPLVCDPFPATTTGATVTQCNGSVTGGGSTADCAVGSASRVSPAVPVRINQCNGTGNAGGTLLTCRSSIRTNLLAVASPSPTATASPSPSATSTPTSMPTSMPTSTSGPSAGAGSGGDTPQVTLVPTGGVPAGSGPGSVVPGGVLLAAGGLLLAAAASSLWWRRTAHDG